MTRLRLTSSRPAGYRRGGIVIGTQAVPTYLSSPDELKPEGLLAILRDPNVAIAQEEEIDGNVVVTKLDDEERVLFADAVAERIAMLGAAEIELQPASGVEGETGGDALPAVDPTTSSEGASNVAAPSDNSPGTETSSAEGSGQTREEADASAADRKADADEGKQPEETSRPPVAEPSNGPSAAAATGKPVGKAKPKGATTAKAD